MAEIRIKDNESLESALRRFKKQCARAGVIQEVRKREAYEKPSVKRKKKSEAAGCSGRRPGPKRPLPLCAARGLHFAEGARWRAWPYSNRPARCTA